MRSFNIFTSSLLIALAVSAPVHVKRSDVGILGAVSSGSLTTIAPGVKARSVDLDFIKRQDEGEVEEDFTGGDDVAEPEVEEDEIVGDDAPEEEFFDDGGEEFFDDGNMNAGEEQQQEELPEDQVMDQPEEQVDEQPQELFVPGPEGGDIGEQPEETGEEQAAEEITEDA